MGSLVALSSSPSWVPKASVSSSSSSLFFCTPFKPLQHQHLTCLHSSLPTVVCSTPSSPLPHNTANTSTTPTALSSRSSTVSVFWDLDNKPPISSPYHAALYLRLAAAQFGSVVDIVAYANRHAFLHVPHWVREERQERRQLDYFERVGIVKPEQPYVCRLCGRKCKTNLDLTKHFKQLHEREQKKRMSRLNMLRGKKRMKFRQAIQPKTARYNEAARPILPPKVGYGLESDLHRAGVYVRTVEDKPQAADMALKKQIAASMSRGIKCICLVSDDHDFSEMLKEARTQNLQTIVFGESQSLRRYADFWFSWEDVSQGLTQREINEAIREWSVRHGLIHKLRSGAPDFSEPRSSSFSRPGREPENLDEYAEHSSFISNAVARTKVSSFSEEELDVDETSEDGEWAFDDADDSEDDEWDFDIE